MICPNCLKNEAMTHSIYGVLPCLVCQKRRLNFKKPNCQIEFTSSDIKEQRKQCADDIIQPFRSGELSKEYLDKYGNKGLVKATEEEKAKAKPIWGDLNYYET